MLTHLCIRLGTGGAGEVPARPHPLGHGDALELPAGGSAPRLQPLPGVAAGRKEERLARGEMLHFDESSYPFALAVEEDAHGRSLQAEAPAQMLLAQIDALAPVEAGRV